MVQERQEMIAEAIEEVREVVIPGMSGVAGLTQEYRHFILCSTRHYRAYSTHAVRWKMWWWEDTDILFWFIPFPWWNKQSPWLNGRRNCWEKNVWSGFQRVKVINWLDKCSQLLRGTEGPFEAHGHNYYMRLVSRVVSFISYIQPFMFRQAWDRWRVELNQDMRVCVCVQDERKK